MKLSTFGLSGVLAVARLCSLLHQAGAACPPDSIVGDVTGTCICPPGYAGNSSSGMCYPLPALSGPGCQINTTQDTTPQVLDYTSVTAGLYNDGGLPMVNFTISMNIVPGVDRNFTAVGITNGWANQLPDGCHAEDIFQNFTTTMDANSSLCRLI